MEKCGFMESRCLANLDKFSSVARDFASLCDHIFSPMFSLARTCFTSPPFLLCIAGFFASIFGGFIDIGHGKIKAFSVCRGGYGITRFSAYDSYELIDAPTFCMQGSFAHAFL